MGPIRLVATVIAAVVLTVRSGGAQQSADSTARHQQHALDSLAAAMRALQARLDSLERTPLAAPSAPPAPARTSGAYMNVSFVGLADFGWSSQPNVRSLQVGDHDPKVRGFSIPNAELALDGTVDPYFKAFANIVYKLDEKGETGVELEEMFMLTTSLPMNLQLKVGQFFAEFGRQNPQHPHSWGFADEPLVLGRMFGPEGLRSQGVRLSWLLPTSWYTEAMFTVMNSAGTTTYSFRSDESSDIHGGVALERPVRGVGDLLYVPRLATSLDLTGTQTLLVGVSGAFGPNNSGPDASTQVYGADLYWKWKSARADQGFPFVSMQSEYLFRRYDAAQRLSAEDVPRSQAAEVLRDEGAYAQLLWGIRPRIVAGLRGEFVQAGGISYRSASRGDRSRWSPNVTWYPTEFSKFRLQYNYDHRAGIGNDHSVWMQFEFLLGAHAAHKF
jgi:hypothetical protein